MAVESRLKQTGCATRFHPSSPPPNGHSRPNLLRLFTAGEVLCPRSSRPSLEIDWKVGFRVLIPGFPPRIASNKVRSSFTH
jgi:hypothetical protein